MKLPKHFTSVPERDIQIKSLGDSHVSVAMTKESIAIVHERLGHIGQDRALYLEAYEIFLRSLGQTHCNTQRAA